MRSLPHFSSSRRRVISIGLAALCLPIAAYAGGDGGGNRTTKKKKKAINPPVLKQEKVEALSVDAFLRMDDVTLRGESSKAKKSGQKFTISGFSPRMSAKLINMMQNDPRSTRRLVRDMRQLKSFKKRESRLYAEVQKQDRRIALYSESIKEGRGSNDATVKARVHEDWQLRQKTRNYRRDVQDWQFDPDEGTK